MKSQVYKWLALVAVLISLVFVATNVGAKKPPKDPPPTDDDPCSKLTSFSPDFAFFRDTGNRKSPKVSIFLAESTKGCEVSLVEFPIISSFDRVRNLRFSAVEDDNSYFGRVVWTRNIGSRSISVWKQDFYIEGANVAKADGTLEILRNSLLDNPIESENIYSLDLSPDTKTLVYQYSHYYPDPGKIDTNLSRRSLRILNIDSCGNQGTDPCRFNDLDENYAYEFDHNIGSTSESIGFYFPSWGPWGERIYVRKSFDDAVHGRYKALRYYDFEKNGQALKWPPIPVYTDTIISDFGKPEDIITDYGYFVRVNSGTIGEVEYLAIEDEYSTKTGGCEGIFIVKAEDCLIDGVCSTDPEFAGAYPSWSKDGVLIHAYDGWVPHGGCHLRSVGIWDRSDGSLESLFDGYWPDAASGVR